MVWEKKQRSQNFSTDSLLPHWKRRWMPNRTDAVSTDRGIPPHEHFAGLDLTPEMIRKAKEKNLPFDAETFDMVINSQSFHHHPDPQTFFKAVHMVLKPERLRAIFDGTQYDPWRPVSYTMEILARWKAFSPG